MGDPSKGGVRQLNILQVILGGSVFVNFAVLVFIIVTDFVVRWGRGVSWLGMYRVDSACRASGRFDVGGGRDHVHGRCCVAGRDPVHGWRYVACLDPVRSWFEFRNMGRKSHIVSPNRTTQRCVRRKEGE